MKDLLFILELAQCQKKKTKIFFHKNMYLLLVPAA